MSKTNSKSKADHSIPEQDKKFLDLLAKMFVSAVIFPSKKKNDKGNIKVVPDGK